MENKTITGSIDYKIEIHENGDFEIEYQRTVENEMAALSASQHIIEHSIAAITVQKREAKGKLKKALSTQLEKLTQARMGVAMLADMIYTGYENYIERKEQHERDMLTADVTTEDVKIINQIAKKK